MERRKAVILLLVILITLPAFAQKDSLVLALSAEYKEQDSANSYIVRLDFTSQKSTSVTFQYQPTFLAICCMDGQQVGLTIEKLEGNCFVPYRNGENCDPIFDPDNPSRIYERIDNRELKPGETISYKEDIGEFESWGRKGKRIGFMGTYRVKGWRHYKDAGQTKKVESNWLYVSFPGPSNAHNIALPK